MPYKNPEDQKRAARSHYQKNKALYGKRARDNTPRYIERNIKFVNKRKSVPCADCGEKFPPVAMDFDHLDASEKINTIARLVHNGSSIEKLKEEMAKCELVCSNCHRIRTHARVVQQEEAAVSKTVS